MRIKGLIVLLLTIFIGCSVSDDNSRENEVLIKKYVLAVEENDIATMESLLADNYVGLGPSANDSINKVGALENWQVNIMNLYESVKYSKSRIISVKVPDGENKGEWVSVWAELKIVYKQDKKEVTVWTNSVYLIENGKIVRSFTFYNEADVLEQLGYVFINPDYL
ncbi:nuclear transport factor 2 family protein [Namhaeicola litoreus]|uniref:Nuclear transport factor 2 family protein n=1 Tax=Namhaeicola litoreus TaxID=1052145 RepID=A0ABW3Y250_9FLAO